ncbi:MAG: hypothetical protein JSR37_07505 [Verrucomicrobia bacterium]|nr:hypothetical protein [Verrucomicrobiota bacterium]MBS0636942.1 hypothetical protein [Verrucomicrobiota bacterium]
MSSVSTVTAITFPTYAPYFMQPGRQITCDGTFSCTIENSIQLLWCEKASAICSESDPNKLETYKSALQLVSDRFVSSLTDPLAFTTMIKDIQQIFAHENEPGCYRYVDKEEKAALLEQKQNVNSQFFEEQFEEQLLKLAKTPEESKGLKEALKKIAPEKMVEVGYDVLASDFDIFDCTRVNHDVALTTLANSLREGILRGDNAEHLGSLVHTELAKVGSLKVAKLVMDATLLHFGGYQPVIISNAEVYTQKVVESMKDPQVFTAYLKTQLIPLTKELIKG